MTFAKIATSSTPRRIAIGMVGKPWARMKGQA
jgi:hypothetical protein